LADGLCQSGSAPAFLGGLTFFIERLADYNYPNLTFDSHRCNCCRIYWARDVHYHSQWVGDGARQVTNGQSKPFSSRINSQDTQHRYCLGS
jgi:hypothetical protein